MSEGSSQRVGRLIGRRELRRELESSSARVVLANGCFDLLHVGHLRYLTAAKTHGELLVVALNTDSSVERLKGPGRPLVPFAERAELVCALAPVDYVVPFDEATLEATLRELLPSVHAKGTDYTLETVPEAPVDHELGIELVICGDPKDHDSSELARRAGAWQPLDPDRSERP